MRTIKKSLLYSTVLTIYSLFPESEQVKFNKQKKNLGLGLVPENQDKLYRNKEDLFEQLKREVDSDLSEESIIVAATAFSG